MSPRLYPEYIPPFDNEPVSERVAIIQTEDCGEGVISLVEVAAGEIVFKFSGLLLHEQTLFTLQYRSGGYVHDPFVMGKVLHSCSPNMSCDMEERIFRATRIIRPGEFLTMDYETTEEELYQPFICNCGSADCRKVIRGRKYTAVPLHPVGNVWLESVTRSSSPA